MSEDKAGSWGAQYKKRWAIIPFMQKSDLEQWHQQEDSRAKRSGLSEGTILEMMSDTEPLIAKNGIRPFWVGKIDENEQADRMRMFRAKIWPIWAPIVNRAWEEEVSGKRNFSDLEVLHKCDKAIFNSGHRADRFSSAQNDKKESVINSAKEAYR